MNDSYIKKLFIIFILLVIFIPVLTSANEFINGLDQSAVQTGHNKLQKDFKITIGKFIGIFYVGVIGVAYMFLLIYAGFKWMLARGNEQDIEKAKNIIIYATLGLGIALISYALAIFVMSYFQKVSIGE